MSQKKIIKDLNESGKKFYLFYFFYIHLTDKVYIFIIIFRFICKKYALNILKLFKYFCSTVFFKLLTVKHLNDSLGFIIYYI